MKRWLRILLVGLGIILLTLIILPLIIPIPPAGADLAPRDLAGEQSQFVDVEGIDLHYQQAGEGGLPLVLLHGFGASVFSWREVLEPLGADRRVVAFDRPAFGLTERPMPPYSGVNPYSQSTQSSITLGLLDELGIEEAILVGNSAGGTVAVLTALEHPERVTALVLIAPAIYSAGGTPNWMQPFLELPQVRRIGPLLVRSIRDKGLELIANAWNDPSKITPEVIDGYTLSLQTKDWDHALWELTLASEDLKLAVRLSDLDLPTLVITGDNDRLVPTELSIRLAEEIPGAELVVIESCGHVPQEECPDAFLEAVGGFLAKINY